METTIHVRIWEGYVELLLILLRLAFKLGRPILRGLVKVGGIFMPLLLNFILDLHEMISSCKAFWVSCLHESER